jgi:hypothetical protein
VISKGRRDRLYDPITKSTSSFVLNASWSLLLYHFDKAFKAAADQVLDTLDETMLVSTEELEARYKAAWDSRSSLRDFQTGWMRLSGKAEDSLISILPAHPLEVKAELVKGLMKDNAVWPLPILKWKLNQPWCVGFFSIKCDFILT